LTSSSSSSLEQQHGMLIDQLPGWYDKKIAETKLFKRKRLSGSQASASRIKIKMSNLYYDNWYKEAFKHATLTIQQSKVESKGKRGHGLRSIISLIILFLIL
jgi:hypothetical protein